MFWLNKEILRENSGRYHPQILINVQLNQPRAPLAYAKSSVINISWKRNINFDLSEGERILKSSFSKLYYITLY